jgi:hypothetical protein
VQTIRFQAFVGVYCASLNTDFLLEVGQSRLET